MISCAITADQTQSPKASHIFEASSIGRVAYSRIERDGEGVVHGVFESAINLLFRDKLVSLVTDTVERGPLNIVLRPPFEADRMSSLGVRAGDKVTMKARSIKLTDRYSVSIRSAEIYSPVTKFSQPVLPSCEIESNIEAARKTAFEFGNMAGLGELLILYRSNAVGDDLQAGNFNIFASSALLRIGRLVQAFQSLNEDALRVTIRELIGLGPGLTPSSDDMLTTLVLFLLLYAKNTGKAVQESRLMARGITREVKNRTTRLSEEYLTQAALGRGNESVTRLCKEILTGGIDSVRMETRRVLSLGETSGTDAVLGIIVGGMLCTKCNFSSLERL